MRNRILSCVLLVLSLVCKGQAPGGQPNEVQTNNAGTSFGGSNLFTDGSSHTSLYSTVPFGFWAHNSSQNLGGSSFQNLFNCMQDSVVGTGGNGSSSCNLYNVLFTAPGLNNGNTPYTGSYTWTTTKVSSVVDNAFTPGIHHVYSTWLNAGKTGDDAAFYAYCFDEGGRVDVSGEGHTCIRANGGNDYTKQYGATSKDTGTGLTTLHTNIAPSYLTPGIKLPTFPLVGGYLIDSSIGPPDLVSGSVTKYDPATQILSVEPANLVPASAIGTTNAAIVLATSDAENGTPATVSVTVTQGSFTSGPMVFGCSDFIDFVNGTVVGTAPNQQITANFMHGHAPNCVVSQGGTQGILDLVADEIGANWKTSYYVFAAPKIDQTNTTNQILVRTYVTGAMDYIHDSRHNFGTSADINGMLTRSGSVVSACNISTGILWQFSGQMVEISGTGMPPTGFDGTFSASNVDARNCLTWNQSGDPVTTGVNGTIKTGGTIGTLGKYNIYPAAMVKKVGFTQTVATGKVQNVFDGSFVLFPNVMKVNANDLILSLFDMSAKTEPLTAYGRFDTPPNNSLNTWHPVTVSGYGVTTEQFQMERLTNGNSYAMYKGGGGSGQMDAPRGLTFQGPFMNTIYMDQPMPGGTVLRIRGNPMAGAGLYSMHNVIFDQGAKGSGGLTMQFDPISGKTLLYSTDGTGVGAAFAFDKTTVDINGPSGLKLEHIPNGPCVYALAAGSDENTVRARCVQVVTGTGCTITTPAIGANCSQTLSIPNAYSDTNYDVAGCTITNGNGLSVIGNVTNTSSSSFTVIQVGLSASSAGGGTIKCIVSHP